MMRAARIENGLVADIWEVPSLDCYGAQYTLVAAPDWVQIGAAYDGATFTNPLPPLNEAKASKKRKIDAARDAACTADVQALGHTWQADTKSQQLLGQAITLAQAGAPLPPVWRTADNIDVPISSIADLLAIAGAIGAQVQAAYAKSWLLKKQLDAATTHSEIDAIVW